MEPPDFLTAAGPISWSERTFRPYPPDRKGEVLAWLTTAAVLLAGIILRMRSGTMPGVTIGLALFLLLAAALITFGNWMDNRTRIGVDRQAIRYASPLRRVRMSWDAVVSLRALHSRRGWQIVIEGQTGRIAFRTPAALEFATAAPIMIGIRAGEDLVRAVVRRADLQILEELESGWRAVSQTAAAQGQG